MISTAGDLVNFGNNMLYSYQYKPSKVDKPQTTSLPGYLKADTVKTLWTPVKNTVCDWDSNGYYGMGWGVIPEEIVNEHSHIQRFYVSHTGAAIGGSSVLLILPRREKEMRSHKGAPQGVVVSILVNMSAVGLNKTALAIAKKFEETV